MNKAIIVGNLCKDPIVKDLGEGKKLMRLTVATNRRGKGDDGSWQDIPTFHYVIVWGRRVEGLEKLGLEKGRKVAIEGEIRVNEFEDKDQVRKRMYEIHTFDVEVVGPRPQGGSAPRAKSGGEWDGGGASDFGDDLPF